MHRYNTARPPGLSIKLFLLTQPLDSTYWTKFYGVRSEEMAQIFKGMVEEHARAGVAHDTADAIAHFRPITMDGAFAA